MTARGEAPSAPTAERVQLFCLPYAGSSARAYGPWCERLPSWIDVRPLELPGHGRRMAEPLEREIGAMVRRLLPEVRSVARAPFAIFGHSMGAIVGFELALALAESGGPEPLIVFASGADAPSRRDRARYAALESDGELLLELERLEGTPELVLRNAELMEIALPILRADFAACAAYSAPAGRALGCPIHVLGGTHDTTTAETLVAWRDHTRRDFSLQMLPGGHFFLHEREADLLASIEARLAELALPQPSERGTGSAAEIERSRTRGGQQWQLR